MIQVKVFFNNFPKQLEADINAFLRTVEKVVDIKFSSSNDYSDAMVIYETEAAE